MKKLILIILLICLSSCMINDDWVTHDIVIYQNTITIDGKESEGISYIISEDNIGITIFIDESIEIFDWHFDKFNEEIKYVIKITENNGITSIYIPHDLNKYPIPKEGFKGVTYIVESYLHFMTNLIKL